MTTIDAKGAHTGPQEPLVVRPHRHGRKAIGYRPMRSRTTMATQQLSERVILEFERPIIDLEKKIEELRGLSTASVDFSTEIRRLEQKARKLQKEVFADLTPQQKVQLSRLLLETANLGRKIDGVRG